MIPCPRSAIFTEAYGHQLQYTYGSQHNCPISLSERMACYWVLCACGLPVTKKTPACAVAETPTIAGSRTISRSSTLLLGIRLRFSGMLVKRITGGGCLACEALRRYIDWWDRPAPLAKKKKCVPIRSRRSAHPQSRTFQYIVYCYPLLPLLRPQHSILPSHSVRPRRKGAVWPATLSPTAGARVSVERALHFCPPVPGSHNITHYPHFPAPTPLGRLPETRRVALYRGLF